MKITKLLFVFLTLTVLFPEIAQAKVWSTYWDNYNYESNIYPERKGEDRGGEKKTGRSMVVVEYSQYGHAYDDWMVGYVKRWKTLYVYSAAMALSRYNSGNEVGDLDLILNTYGTGVAVWKFHTYWGGNCDAYKFRNSKIYFAPYNVLIPSSYTVGTSKINIQGTFNPDLGDDHKRGYEDVKEDENGDAVHDQNVIKVKCIKEEGCEIICTKKEGCKNGAFGEVLQVVPYDEVLQVVNDEGELVDYEVSSDDPSFVYGADRKPYQPVRLKGYDTSESGPARGFADDELCGEDGEDYGQTDTMSVLYPDMCKNRTSMYRQWVEQWFEDTGFYLNYESGTSKPGVLTLSFEKENELNANEDKPFIRGNIEVQLQNLFIRLHLETNKQELSPIHGSKNTTGSNLDSQPIPANKLEGLFEGLIDDSICNNGASGGCSTPNVFVSNVKILAFKSKYIVKTSFENPKLKVASFPTRTVTPKEISAGIMPAMGGIDNGIGVLYTGAGDKKIDLYENGIDKVTQGQVFFRPFLDDLGNKTAYEKAEVFRVSPMIYDDVPFFEYYLPIKTTKKVANEGGSAVDENQTDGLLFRKDKTSPNDSYQEAEEKKEKYYGVIYAQCSDEFCRDYSNKDDMIKYYGTDDIEWSQIFSMSNVVDTKTGFYKLENVPSPDDVSRIMIHKYGTRLLPLTDISSYYDNDSQKTREPIDVDCYIATKASPNVEETIGEEEKTKINSKIYSVCHFPGQTAIQNAKKDFDLVIADSGSELGTEFKYKLAFKPVWGEPIVEGSNTIYPVTFEWVNDASEKPDFISQMVGAFVDGASTNKVKMYGIVVGDNGMENYYYKINFKTETEESVIDRLVNIYADKEIKEGEGGVTGFDGKNHVFFESSLVGDVENNKFTDNVNVDSSGVDLYKDSKFQTKWSEMKLMYDQLGREVTFKIIRDLGNQDDKSPIITIGYIKDALIELIDPFTSEEGAEEVCDGAIFCTLQNFITTEEYTKPQPNPSIEPLSKIECSDESNMVDYLCLGSSESDWDFTNYGQNCAKTIHFRTFIVNALKGESITPPDDNSSALENILKLEPKSGTDESLGIYQWCMPLYTKDEATPKVERITCEDDKMTTINDSSYTCTTCTDNKIPNTARNDCEACPEGKVPEEATGKCIEPPPQPPDESECQNNNVAIDADNTCSCKGGSVQTYNSDRTKFMCLECESGLTPDPDDFGKCVTTAELELRLKIEECEKTGVSVWDYEVEKCIMKIAKSTSCPSDGVFIINDKNQNCLCEDGTSPVINSTNNTGQCGEVNPAVTSSSDGGCSLATTRDNIATIFISILAMLVIVSEKARKAGKVK